MSQEERDTLIERLNGIERMIIESRDRPQDETISKLFYGLDKKLDVLIVKQDATHEQACKTNGRVNVIEEWKATLTGKIAIIMAVVSFMVYKFF
jgi:hypothetical protein